MSDTQLMAGLQSVGADEAIKSQVIAAYSLERTQAFREGLWFLVFISVLGLLMTAALPKRKLVESG